MTLLIDGHNLIGVMPDIDLTDPDDEWQLVQRLRTFALTRRQPLTVVFDSGVGPSPHWQMSGDGVTVRFAPPNVEADAVIVQLLKASPQPRRVTVVTNDQGLAGKVRAAGGQVRSARQFVEELMPARSTATAAALEPPPNARAPEFVDIYQGFLQGAKDQVRFGGDIALTTDVWIERLYGDDIAEAERAARWLGRFGGRAGLDPLLDALSHRAGQVRAAALLALADLGDAAAVSAIGQRLASDGSGMVREAAAQALGRLGGSVAADALRAGLQDPKPKVRKAAAASLQQLQARR